MTKISQLSDIGNSLAADDEFIIRDVSDVSTPNKKVTASGFFAIANTLGITGFDNILAGLPGTGTQVRAISSGAAIGISGYTQTTISGITVARTTISGYYENASGVASGVLYPVVTQVDIGTAANQVPLNGNLGTMAFQDSAAVNIDTASVGQFTTPISTGPGSAAAPTFTFTGNTNTGIYSPGTDQFAVTTSGVERVRVSPSGVISLGTAVPSGAKVVSISQTTDTDNTTPTVNIYRRFDSGGGSGSMEVGLNVNIPACWNNNSTTAIKAYAANVLDYTSYAIDAEAGKQNNGTSRAARFTGGHGNTVGYGTQNVVDIIAGVAGGGIQGKVRGLYIQNPNYDYTSGAGENIGLLLNDLTTAAVTHSAIRFDRNTTAVGSITTTLSATAYNTSSDYRLKENVINLDNAISRLAKLPVHRFNFINDPGRIVDGFLAHEVAPFVPEAVTGKKDAVQISPKMDENNKPVLDNAGKEIMEEIPIYQSIDHSKLVPLLTAALQEAVTKITALEARLSALEAN
jgi:hypothetical protein